MWNTNDLDDPWEIEAILTNFHHHIPNCKSSLLKIHNHIPMGVKRNQGWQHIVGQLEPNIKHPTTILAKGNKPHVTTLIWTWNLYETHVIFYTHDSSCYRNLVYGNFYQTKVTLIPAKMSNMIFSYIMILLLPFFLDKTQPL